MQASTIRRIRSLFPAFCLAEDTVMLRDNWAAQISVCLEVCSRRDSPSKRKNLREFERNRDLLSGSSLLPEELERLRPMPGSARSSREHERSPEVSSQPSPIVDWPDRETRRDSPPSWPRRTTFHCGRAPRPARQELRPFCGKETLS